MENTQVNSTLLKSVNRKKILSVIDDSKKLSRVEVKNVLGKNGKTVTNIINSLIEDDFVKSIGFSSFTGGRRREMLEINRDYGYIIGIHLGIYYIRGIITDFNYKVLVEEKIPIVPEESKSSLIQKIKKTLSFLVNSKSIPNDKLLGIGFVANGFYDHDTGEWIQSVNNLNWKNVEIKKILSDAYDVPIFLEDSTRAMALGEKYFGLAKNKKNYMYLDLGVGIGCGIVQRGRIFRGSSNLASEFGHTIVVPNGEKCSCGNRGCLETITSGWAINKKVKEEIKNGAETEIMNLCNSDLDKLEIDMVFKAYSNGDRLATEILDNATDFLGVGIANLINLLNPELIVFGGHFAMLGDFFFDKLRKKIKKYALPISFSKVELLTSALDDNVAVLGATTLVREPYFDIDAIR